MLLFIFPHPSHQWTPSRLPQSLLAIGVELPFTWLGVVGVVGVRFSLALSKGSLFEKIERGVAGVVGVVVGVVGNRMDAVSCKWGVVINALLPLCK